MVRYILSFLFLSLCLADDKSSPDRVKVAVVQIEGPDKDLCVKLVSLFLEELRKVKSVELVKRNEATYLISLVAAEGSGLSPDTSRIEFEEVPDGEGWTHRATQVTQSGVEERQVSLTVMMTTRDGHVVAEAKKSDMQPALPLGVRGTGDQVVATAVVKELKKKLKWK